MTKKERLQIMAENIKMVEIRIADLVLRLKQESNVLLKLDMQQSLKTNRVMLKELKEQFWNADSDNAKQNFPSGL
jgi:hypothetical protein